MENLLFSLNATMPIFLMMCVGYFLHAIGWLDDDLAKGMNTFVFRVPLPVMVFHQLAATDFARAWDTRFVLFCFFATLLSVALVSLISRLALRDNLERRGEFIQASYRSSAALLGIAYIQNIYGDAGMAPLMILGAVPLYNIFAVVVLELTDPENTSGKLSKAVLRKTLRGILTNPIIVGIVCGFAWSLLHIPMTGIIDKVFSNLAAVASPLGLMAMGASLDLKKLRGDLPPALLAAFIKLLGLGMLFLPVAVSLGFRAQKLVAITIMLGSATTVSSYTMATNMHHEGALTACTVALTTLLASFTLTFWIFLTRSLGLI